MQTSPAPRFLSEDTWIERLKQGDEFAWELLVARFAPHLRRTIQMYLHSSRLSLDLLDDVESETWRTVVRRIREFEWMGDEKMKHWLGKIAHHHVQSFARADRQYLPSLEDIQGRNLENEFALDLFMYANGLVTSSAEDVSLLRERLTDLDAALQELSARDREIMLATLLDNADRGQLASQYDVEENTISQIVWRAKAKLRAQLNARRNEETNDE
jgi:RNA polymerase sigma-70 factor (ECF subfamily)